jgi:hypothetical protein
MSTDIMLEPYLYNLALNISFRFFAKINLNIIYKISLTLNLNFYFNHYPVTFSLKHNLKRWS